MIHHIFQGVAVKEEEGVTKTEEGFTQDDYGGSIYSNIAMQPDPLDTTVKKETIEGECDVKQEPTEEESDVETEIDINHLVPIITTKYDEHE